MVEFLLALGGMMQYRMRRNVAKWLSAFFLVASTTLINFAWASELSTCTSFPAVMQVSGESWYVDGAGSVVNEEALHRHEEKIKPLRDYVTYVVRKIDNADFDCAESNLEAWAADTALYKKPANFAGVRERLRFSTALELAAVRLKAAGHPVEEKVQRWLAHIAKLVATDFGKREFYDNLRMWSGVSAGATAIIAESDDKGLLNYADDVWIHGVAAIRHDGTIEREVGRKSRALLYHAYYLSAMLFLRQERESRGIPITLEENEALARLYDLIRMGTCNSESFAEIARVTPKQEPINGDDFATIIAFLPQSADTSKLCYKKGAGSYYPILGGDLRSVLTSIKQASTRR